MYKNETKKESKFVHKLCEMSKIERKKNTVNNRANNHENHFRNSISLLQISRFISNIRVAFKLCKKTFESSDLLIFSPRVTVW